MNESGNNMEFKGIYTPAITPCHDDMSIDKDGFAQVLDHLIDEGVNGIIIAGTTGEYYAHTMEERIEMLKFGISTAVSLWWAEQGRCGQKIQSIWPVRRKPRDVMPS